jgi:hypothetical protein
LPSFDHAAARGVSRANRPRERAEILIIALSHGVRVKGPLVVMDQRKWEDEDEVSREVFFFFLP